MPFFNPSTKKNLNRPIKINKPFKQKAKIKPTFKNRAVTFKDQTKTKAISPQIYPWKLSYPASL